MRSLGTLGGSTTFGTIRIIGATPASYPASLVDACRMRSGVRSVISLTSLSVLSFDCWSPDNDEKAQRYIIVYFRTAFFYCVAGYCLLFVLSIGTRGGKSAAERVLAFLRLCSLAEVELSFVFGCFFSSSRLTTLTCFFSSSFFCVSNLSFDCFGPGGV